MSSRILVLVATRKTTTSLFGVNATRTTPSYSEKSYHMSSCLGVGQIWRKQQGLPKNPNAYGPLTDGPDYSFIDGRPTPPGSGKIKRAERNLLLSKKIIKLSKEMDFAVELNKQKQQAEETRKSNILQRKLKPKGKEMEE